MDVWTPTLCQGESTFPKLIYSKKKNNIQLNFPHYTTPTPIDGSQQNDNIVSVNKDMI